MANIADLPDEVWVLILDLLAPFDVIALQSTNKRLLKLARDDKIWLRKCCECAPGSRYYTGRTRVPVQVAGRRRSLERSTTSSSTPPLFPAARVLRQEPRNLSQVIADWDCSGKDEQVDWYSEFIARHAPLHTIWSERPQAEADEVRGVAIDTQSERAVSCQQDGSIVIWDIREQDKGGRKFKRTAKSHAGILYATDAAQSSQAPDSWSFSGPNDGITLAPRQNRAYIAVDRVLNEVDLETLQVVSQQQFAWRITALSQHCMSEAPLSVGTIWSLHLYDPRMTLRDRSRSPEDLMRSSPGEPEQSIAFFPNYTKEERFRGEGSVDPYDRAAYRLLRGSAARYAPVEPGPLSILHHSDHEIFLSGRFPSILSYDRRYFPRMQYVIHSGARLSSLASIPHPPKRVDSTSSDTNANATLVAAGEYGGRGSLELYSLPHHGVAEARETPSPADLGVTTQADLDRLRAGSARLLGATTQADLDRLRAESAPLEDQLRQTYSYRNRQDAASSKILSVGSQGTRIVFSDAEGGINWLERDGRRPVRRWNINSGTGAETRNPTQSSHSTRITQSRRSSGNSSNNSSEFVARKIIPFASSQSFGLHDEINNPGENKRTHDQQRDLLIWTGERLGIVTTQPQWEDHEELVRTFEDMDVNDREERERAEREEEYAREMRRALERQADERIWMARFNNRRGMW